LTARGRNRVALFLPIAMGLLIAITLLLLSIPPYLAWLTAWGIATFATYAVDKAQAHRGAWRVPEAVLHALSLAGGVVGGWLGMLALRHKTRKPIFWIVLALASIVWAGIGLYASGLGR